MTDLIRRALTGRVARTTPTPKSPRERTWKHLSPLRLPARPGLPPAAPWLVLAAVPALAVTLLPRRPHRADRPPAPGQADQPRVSSSS
ncbi:hypothetical protein [Streptomyces antimycoticus]|uniref:hypothetical protein n=1 Tax=Streptomyces antimycoticus TaxID=68175 RepID=UPI0038640DE7|nr:hypothetical protein OG751_07150 [Streptomyces antimycoticus]